MAFIKRTFNKAFSATSSNYCGCVNNSNGSILSDYGSNSSSMKRSVILRDDMDEHVSETDNDDNDSVQHECTDCLLNDEDHDEIDDETNDETDKDVDTTDNDDNDDDDNDDDKFKFIVTNASMVNPLSENLECPDICVIRNNGRRYVINYTHHALFDISVKYLIKICKTQLIQSNHLGLVFYWLAVPRLFCINDGKKGCYGYDQSVDLWRELTDYDARELVSHQRVNLRGVLMAVLKQCVKFQWTLSPQSTQTAGLKVQYCYSDVMKWIAELDYESVQKRVWRHARPWFVDLSTKYPLILANCITENDFITPSAPPTSPYLIRNAQPNSNPAFNKELFNEMLQINWRKCGPHITIVFEKTFKVCFDSVYETRFSESQYCKLRIAQQITRAEWDVLKFNGPASLDSMVVDALNLCTERMNDRIGSGTVSKEKFMFDVCYF